MIGHAHADDVRHAPELGCSSGTVSPRACTRGSRTASRANAPPPPARRVVPAAAARSAVGTVRVNASMCGVQLVDVRHAGIARREARVVSRTPDARWRRTRRARTVRSARRSPHGRRPTRRCRTASGAAPRGPVRCGRPHASSRSNGSAATSDVRTPSIETSTCWPAPVVLRAGAARRECRRRRRPAPAGPPPARRRGPADRRARPTSSSGRSAPG